MAAIGYSTTAIFVKLAYVGGMKPLPLVTLRFFLSAWLMFFYLFFTNKINISQIPSKLIRLGIPGFLGYGGAAVGFLLSLAYLKAPIASILLYTYPIFVTILSAIFFQETLTVRRILALAITFSGILFVINVFDQNSITLAPLGVLFSLIAALSYAFFNVYGQKNIKNTPPMLLSFYTLAVGALILPMISNPFYFLKTSHSLANLGFGLALAVFCTVLPMILYFKGLEKVKASVASIIASFEPIFTVVFATIVLGDTITSIQIIGGILILIGILVLQSEGK